MKTVIKKVDPENPDEEVISQGAEIIRAGGLVAFPTETVYGLGANGLSGEACRRIYAAKGRPSDNPLILHIAGEEGLTSLVREVPEAARKLMEAFWPGPLTIIFPKSDMVPPEVTGGLSTVAVRFPAGKTAAALIKKSGVPIAAPSANSSGKPSPTRASHVEFDLGGKIDMIIDGGPAEVGLESTIADATAEPVALLRPGAVTLEMLREVLGEVAVDPAVLGKASDAPPKAPGMRYTHYSPIAEVFLAEGPDMAEKIRRRVREDIRSGRKAGVLATLENMDRYDAGTVLCAGSRSDLPEIGANLFKLLRKFDYLGMDRVYCETVPDTGEGLAIMNRLMKAAGGRKI